MLRYHKILDDFRSELNGISLSDFLRSPDYETHREQLNYFLNSLPEGTTTTANFYALGKLAARLDLPKSLITMEKRLNGDRAWELVAGALAYIFEIPEFLHKSHAVETAFPDFVYDKDGLLIDFPAGGALTKDGLLLNDRFIPYDPWLASKPCQRSLSFGLIDSLLHVRRKHPNVRHFGLRLRDDLVIDRAFYEEFEHRAYVWGPKDLTEEKLVDPWFPPVASGTLTVHSRLEETSWLSLLFRGLSRIEVMWSRQGQLKTVQIEELVVPDSPMFVDSDEICTAYLHSIWDCSNRAFVHLDGAVKGYDRQSYLARFRTGMHRRDLKANSYRKVFRIDANFSANEWADLVSKYFFYDELVVEYLSSLLSDSPVTIAPPSGAET